MSTQTVTITNNLPWVWNTHSYYNADYPNQSGNYRLGQIDYSSFLPNGYGVSLVGFRCTAVLVGSFGFPQYQYIPDGLSVGVYSSTASFVPYSFPKQQVFGQPTSIPGTYNINLSGSLSGTCPDMLFVSSVPSAGPPPNDTSWSLTLTNIEVDLLLVPGACPLWQGYTGGGTPVAVLTGTERPSPNNGEVLQFISVSFPNGYAPGTNINNALGRLHQIRYQQVRPRGMVTGRVVGGILRLYDSSGAELAAGTAIDGADVWRAGT